MADYVKMPEGDYQDICNEVRRLTGTEENLTSGGIREALADAGGLWHQSTDGGKVVPPPGYPGGSLITQTSRTVTENGTYDTTTNNSVVVNVPTSGGGGAQVYTISGTGATPQQPIPDITSLQPSVDGSTGAAQYTSELSLSLGGQAGVIARGGPSPSSEATDRYYGGNGYYVVDMHYDSDGVYPVAAKINGTDYTQYIPSLQWVLTIFDNRGA